MKPPNSPYKMELSLNVLTHLGIHLYSNVAAVVSEVVANAWDADAKRVTIDVDVPSGRIEITDDGSGMNLEDINDRYLMVGYQKREDPEVPKISQLKRAPMGRKGIGKLSLFSIARRIEVHSIKGGVKNAFLMDVDEIERSIKEKKGTYTPDPIPPVTGDLVHGTRIVLTGLKARVSHAAESLRRRVARRFSIIGPSHEFEVFLDGAAIKPTDRDYYHKVEYIWHYGDAYPEIKSECTNVKIDEARPNEVAPGLKISGWIGSVHGVGQLRDMWPSKSS